MEAPLAHTSGLLAPAPFLQLQYFLDEGGLLEVFPLVFRRLELVVHDEPPLLAAVSQNRVGHICKVGGAIDNPLKVSLFQVSIKFFANALSAPSRALGWSRLRQYVFGAFEGVGIIELNLLKLFQSHVSLKCFHQFFEVVSLTLHLQVSSSMLLRIFLFNVAILVIPNSLRKGMPAIPHTHSSSPQQSGVIKVIGG